MDWISEITIERFKAKGKVYEIQPPLVLHTKQLNDGLYCAEYEPWNLMAYGETDDGVRADAETDIAMLWRHYAEAPVETLTRNAIRLKNDLLARIKVTPVNATPIAEVAGRLSAKIRERPVPWLVSVGYNEETIFIYVTKMARWEADALRATYTEVEGYPVSVVISGQVRPVGEG